MCQGFHQVQRHGQGDTIALKDKTGGHDLHFACDFSPCMTVKNVTTFQSLNPLKSQTGT